MSEVQPAQVQKYWEKVAEKFDTIYSGEKNMLQRWLDRIFRKDMYDRYRLTLEECGDEQITSVLDVGTGSGRFCLPLADTKQRIVGLDFSQPMIDLARQRAQEQGVADKCDFRVGDFLQFNVEQPFDAVMAIGVFDYVRDPIPFLEKMARVAKRKVIATYPTLWSWRVLPRWIRLTLGGCPVFFFRPSQIQAYYRQVGLEISRFERVGKIYFVVAAPPVSSQRPPS